MAFIYLWPKSNMMKIQTNLSVLLVTIIGFFIIFILGYQYIRVKEQSLYLTSKQTSDELIIEKYCNLNRKVTWNPQKIMLHGMIWSSSQKRKILFGHKKIWRPFSPILGWVISALIIQTEILFFQWWILLALYFTSQKLKFYLCFQEIMSATVL